MAENKDINNYWAMRCKLNDAHKGISPDDVARFRAEYADIFRSYKDKNGCPIYTEEEVHFEAYKYYDDKEIAAYIHHGQTPEGLAEIMSM